MRRINWFEDGMQDLAYARERCCVIQASRSSRMLTLALGIGANTAIFSVVHTTLLQPLPYAHPEQLVELRETETAPGDWISPRRTWQTRQNRCGK